MGAPTGSAEVCSNMCPTDTGWRAFAEAKPLMVMVAAPAADCFLIAPQLARSGIQVWAAACCGVSLVKGLPWVALVLAVPTLGTAQVTVSVGDDSDRIGEGHGFRRRETITLQ